MDDGEAEEFHNIAETVKPFPNVGMHKDLFEVPRATEAPRERPFQKGSADDHPRGRYVGHPGKVSSRAC